MSVIFSNLRRFGKAEDGTIALIFSLVAIMLALITGLAIDFGRTYNAATKMGAAIDAAALAAAKGLRLDNLNDGEVQVLAKRYFDENMAAGNGSYATIRGFNVNVDRNKGAVEVAVDAFVPTTFWAIAGKMQIDLPKSSVAIFDAKDIEVGLQLDVTGSMGGQKLRDLKTATKDFVDILIPDEPTGQKVRIGYAPYSGGVNAGAYALAVNGNRASNGCVYERNNPALEARDDAPMGTGRFKILADLPATLPPGARDKQADCPRGARILPMTDDKALLKSTVDGYSANGWTSGQLGSAWAWYLISPNFGAGIWPSASQPAPYRDGQTIKVAVLMTDGTYNTISGVAWDDYSSQAAQAGAKAEAICSAMKAEGVIVYTVGFAIGSAPPVASDTLRDCASSPGNFYRAENGAELRSAFRDIAEQITSLRLSK